jgi:hypothetical protein
VFSNSSAHAPGDSTRNDTAPPSFNGHAGAPGATTASLGSRAPSKVRITTLSCGWGLRGVPNHGGGRSSAVSDGGEAVPATTTSQTKNGKAEKHQDLTPVPSTVEVEAEVGRAKLATCAVQGSGALSRLPRATPPLAMPPNKPRRASTPEGQGQSKRASNRTKDDPGSLPPQLGRAIWPGHLELDGTDTAAVLDGVATHGGLGLLARSRLARTKEARPRTCSWPGTEVRRETSWTGWQKP